MIELERFKNIGDIKINIYKSSSNDYSFYLQLSNKEVLDIADIIDNTLNNIK